MPDEVGPIPMALSTVLSKRAIRLRCGLVALSVGGASYLAAVLARGGGPAISIPGAVLTAIAVFLTSEAAFLGPLRRTQRALALSEAQRRRLEEAANDPVLRIRPATQRVDVSQALEALLGYSSGEARSLSVRGIVHPGDLDMASRIYKGLSRAAPRATATLRLRHRDGSTLWVEASFHRTVGFEGPAETVIKIQNVTSRHQESERLHMAMEAARTAQADATTANKAKTEFLARMSHEIRTPLNAVIGFTALLLELPALSPQGRHYGERIKSAGHALLTIVNDILDFAQVESGVVALNKKPFALPLLVDECLSIVQQAATAKRLLLDVTIADPLPSGMLGDEARLRQILINLLNNAIKFTNEGSVKLDIRLERTAGAASCVRFSIIDTGIGIAAEDQADLFQRFRQVDGTIRRTYGGTGLGLAISKQLVELMGGTIGVESGAGRGSTFWFALDLPAAPLLLQPDRKPHYAAKRRLSLLLVEDVTINQELVCLILEAGGHKVEVVSNGAEAIMAAEDTLYDAILMDIQMPYVDGLTATKTIRDLPGHAGTVPIIAMTANVLPEQIRMAKAAGMDDIIHKPFTASEIYAVLDRMADRSGVDAMPAVPLDWAVLLKLAGLIGEAKVKALLGSMGASLEQRFLDDASTATGKAALRRDAHSSIAGAGMLGFKLFSFRCQALESADDDAFDAVLVALKADLVTVRATAKTLAEQTAPLARAA